ncbi:tetratricopeptide repeat protein [Sphingomonas sp. ac-8]|uniref:tetratricopeptide repeat protein n=1 Tax=Sphingomonas sp. ac-8 TaxID=3242977 RepID=UPI003A7F9247
MALTPQNNQAFLREVDEELRRDQMASFGKRWGLWIALAVVLLLAGFGSWIWWKHHRTEQQAAQGVLLQQAMDDIGASRVNAAGAPLAELANSDSDGFRASAKFVQADVLLRKQDLKGAAAKFAEVANDASMPGEFRDLALVRQTAAEYDTLKPQAVVDRLRGLATKQSPWFGSAGEMVAIAYLRMNRRDLAGKMFGEIAATDSVPESIRQRAVQMASGLGVDAAAPQATATPTSEEKNAG